MFETLDNIFYRISARFFVTPEKIEAGRQFLTFCVIGIGNTIIDFGIYYWLTRYTVFFNYETPRKYIANSISFLAATTFSFIFNRTWTFRQKARPSLNEVMRFYATTLSGLLINNGILFLFNQYGGLNDIVSKAFSTVFSTAWNFTFKKMWVFAPEEAKQEPKKAF
ncbi:MAG TPA: GtrA family protein [Candidatus Paceibacterota bacterium]|jgi:putative flippase GtrA|nr:GtrA family protein [Candidatus Paceibacterota bacterium]